MTRADCRMENWGVPCGECRMECRMSNGMPDAEWNAGCRMECRMPMEYRMPNGMPDAEWNARCRMECPMPNGMPNAEWNAGCRMECPMPNGMPDAELVGYLASHFHSQYTARHRDWPLGILHSARGSVIRHSACSFGTRHFHSALGTSFGTRHFIRQSALHSALGTSFGTRHFILHSALHSAFGTSFGIRQPTIPEFGIRNSALANGRDFAMLPCPEVREL
jgi:hypothetical protein